MMEVLRRVLLALGVFSGLWFLAALPHTLFRVEPVDWNAERLRRQDYALDAALTMSGEVGADTMKGIDLAPETRGSLEQFIQSRTRDRLLKVQGESWAGFFNAAAATSLGRPPTPEWSHRQGRSFYNDSLYFRPDEGPLPTIVNSFDKERSFQYVAITASDRTEYLAVTRISGNDILTQAPFELAYPTRHLGWSLLLVTLFAYALLPWPRVARDSIRYSRVRGSVLPDLIGAVVGGMFFILPVLVTNSNGYGEGIFGPGGWAWLTGGCWFIGLLILAVWPIAAWFTVLRMEIRADGLQLTTLKERILIDPRDIEAVTIGRMDSPKLSRALIIISALVSWRALGMALIASRPEYAFKLRLRTGRTLGFAGTGLIGMPQMIGWLRQQGVPLDPQVFELINRKPNDPVYTQAFPQLGRGTGTAIALLCVAIPLAFGWMKTQPSQPLVITPGSLAAQPYVKSPSREWAPSPELMAKEEALLKELTLLHTQMDQIDRKLKTAPKTERAALLKEYNSCFDRVNKIQAEFDQARKAAGAKD